RTLRAHRPPPRRTLLVRSPPRRPAPRSLGGIAPPPPSPGRRQHRRVLCGRRLNSNPRETSRACRVPPPPPPPRPLCAARNQWYLLVGPTATQHGSQPPTRRNCPRRPSPRHRLRSPRARGRLLLRPLPPRLQLPGAAPGHRSPSRRPVAVGTRLRPRCRLCRPCPANARLPPPRARHLPGARRQRKPRRPIARPHRTEKIHGTQTRRDRAPKRHLLVQRVQASRPIRARPGAARVPQQVRPRWLGLRQAHRLCRPSKPCVSSAKLATVQSGGSAASVSG